MKKWAMIAMMGWAGWIDTTSRAYDIDQTGVTKYDVQASSVTVSAPQASMQDQKGASHEQSNDGK